jgi:hypothetical protein
MSWPKRRTSTLERQLQRENHELAMRLLPANSELATKQQYAERLKYLLRQRTERIDELNAKLEAARTANRRLEDECEHLAQLVAQPQLNAATRKLVSAPATASAT